MSDEFGCGRCGQPFGNCACTYLVSNVPSPPRSEKDRIRALEAERDELASAKAEIAEAASILMQERDKAEADLSALKARAVEVLEPFAKVAAQYEGCDADSFTSFGWKVFRFRRAAELHATLSGEQK